MLYAEFAHEPHHLLNIERAFPSIDPEHASPLLEVLDQGNDECALRKDDADKTPRLAVQRRLEV
jgi:hypothetical protein